jgi:hypothetical protein
MEATNSRPSPPLSILAKPLFSTSTTQGPPKVSGIVSPTAQAQSTSPLGHPSLPMPFQSRALTRSTTTNSIFRSLSNSRRPPPSHSLDFKQPNESVVSQSTRLTKISSEPAVSPSRAEQPISMSRRMKQARKTSGTTIHCGRNSNDWLFAGISVRESVRALRKEQHDQSARESFQP